MPEICFSYPSDVPPGARIRSAAPSAPPGLRRMPTSICFSYPVVSWCFSPDPGDEPRRMPMTCYSYSADTPLGVTNRDAAPADLPGLRRMPTTTCFRY